MFVSSSLFDIVLFGSLLLAAVVDYFVPALAGTTSLLTVGFAAYVGAQELSHIINRPQVEPGGAPAPMAEPSAQQESLSTGLTLSSAGFVYYWWLNDSDLALLFLSVGLMMASLMVAICVISACGASWRHRSPAPLLALALTTFAAVMLGALAGVWTLSPMLVKIAVTAVGAVAWVVRDRQRLTDTATPGTAGAPTKRPVQHAPGHPLVTPERGSLLDRFVPILVVGAVLFLVFNHVGPSVGPLGPAASAHSNTPQP